MTMTRSEQYGDQMSRLYPELFQKIKGEKIMAQTITFQVTDDCNLACRYCVSGDTQIRMADYSLKAIKDIELGDEILGYEEYPETGRQTKVVKATVEQLFQRKSKVLDMRFATGESVQITPNHKILVRRNSYDNRYDYVEAGKLKPGDTVYHLPIIDNLNAMSSYRFIKSVSPSIPRKRFEPFLNCAPLKKTEIISITESDTEVSVYNIGTSSHTYIANSIAVHNCYQINKGKRRMSLETAKKFVDLLLDSTPENNSYINPERSPFIVLDFIGGEPLLEVDLIDEIVTYFMEETFNRMHPWAGRFRVSICSNGVLYFEPNVQRFLKKHRDHLSLSITIDGNKELHDSCRVFHDGRPSYDLAVAAAKDWMDNYGDMGSKITIAPENLEHVYEALVHMVELGYTEINANCVFEEGWEQKHATELYAQMKRFADYLIDNDLQDSIYCSLFEEMFFKPMPEEMNDNWCGGTGVMLSCDPDGYLYPCIRYMESSLGDEQPPIRIGHVDTGLVTTEEEIRTVKCMKCVTRRSQSTDECFYCPIADGCAWCFPAGTKVSTPDGLVDIEKVKSGDTVLDKDGKPQRVYRNLGREANDLVYVKAAGLRDLLTTKEHPFWCKPVIGCDGGVPVYGEPRWVAAGDLKASDRIALFTPKPGVEDVGEDFACACGFDLAHTEGECVHRSVWDWDCDSIMAFLRGFFKANRILDGSQTPMRFSSSSHELVLNVSELMRMVYHVNVSITEHGSAETGTTYEVQYLPETSSAEDCYEFDEENNVMWVNVSPSKKDVPDKATVFNLSVENNPTFIANGAIVHNCSAYNYQVFGTVDKRATFICEMHKARSLANVYYWNKVYEKEGSSKRFQMHCPEEWAVPIIGDEEYSYLLKLSQGGEHED